MPGPLNNALTLIHLRFYFSLASRLSSELLSTQSLIVRMDKAHVNREAATQVQNMNCQSWIKFDQWGMFE